MTTHMTKITEDLTQPIVVPIFSNAVSHCSISLQSIIPASFPGWTTKTGLKRIDSEGWYFMNYDRIQTQSRPNLGSLTVPITLIRRKVPAPFFENNGSTGFRAHRFQPLIVCETLAASLSAP